MANTLFFVSLSLTIVSAFSFLPFLANAISSCNDACSTLNDRAGKLMIICINGKCNEDPDVGTHLCSRGSGQPSKGTCHSSGILACGNKYYFQYKCSPPVTSSTRAHLTLNVSEGDDNGGPSKCDGQYHMNSSPVVSLSTGWYNHGSRCGKIIRITANNGRSVNAKVVDECDSIKGCDKEHAYQPPCMYNIVDGSSTVWDALGLNKDLHIVDVTWSMA